MVGEREVGGEGSDVAEGMAEALVQWVGDVDGHVMRGMAGVEAEVEVSSYSVSHFYK